ncbi:MAG: hypothetical protein RIT45_3425 [Pseudomonadota bacterium]|jgi:hypothetical protein
MSNESPKSQAGVFGELLELGVTALHLDARIDSVRVPPWLRDRGWLVLNYSYRYNIADFEFDDQGVFASLSFGGRPFPCWVPWSAVFAISDAEQQRLLLWPERIPADQVEALLPAALRAALPPDVVLEQTGDGLFVYPAAPVPPPAAPANEAARASAPPFLRVVHSAVDAGGDLADEHGDSADAAQQEADASSVASAPEPPPDPPRPKPTLRIIKS